ncbi:MAG: tail fiber domain-containing protein, partial [Chitinophagales bacterium]|nr:tail fiber domain-containing protein [Chitinophagales bacterium]
DTPGFALVIEGDITYSGTAYYVSDQQLKKNVEDISNATDIISRLHPKEYEYKQEDYPYIKLPNGIQRGLLAQEVQQVLPDLVRDITLPAKRDTSGKILAPQAEFKGINYEGFTPIILKALQEQQAMIDSLARELAEVKSRMNNCCGSEIQYRNNGTGEYTQEETHQQSIKLSNHQQILLNQNQPNPFAESTVIDYIVPENAASAEMHFTTLSGFVIRTVALQTGKGRLTVFAQDLSSGIYSYSLVVDGKVMETKKMVKTR